MACKLTRLESDRECLDDSKRLCTKGDHANNKDELIESIERAWEVISMETLEIFLASMPHRMKAIINAGGGSTRW